LQKDRRQGAGCIFKECNHPGARLGLGFATYCPGLVFGPHSTKISAFPAFSAFFAKLLEDKGDLALFSSRFWPGSMPENVISGQFRPILYNLDGGVRGRRRRPSRPAIRPQRDDFGRPLCFPPLALCSVLRISIPDRSEHLEDVLVMLGRGWFMSQRPLKQIVLEG
jgi:hypothetical protein